MSNNHKHNILSILERPVCLCEIQCLLFSSFISHAGIISFAWVVDITNKNTLWNLLVYFFPTSLFWHAFKRFLKTFAPCSIDVLQNSALKPGYSHLHIEIPERKIVEIISSRKNEMENNADACFLWYAQKRTTLKLWGGKNV